MRIVLISPRLAVQKRDFLGSGIPYWPLELAITCAFLKDKGESVTVIDLFGSSPTELEDSRDHYLQGMPFSRFVDSSKVKDAELFILFAISYMSHKELLNIAESIRSNYPEVPIAVLENSQAVTAYNIAEVAVDFFNHGVGALICGEIYWNYDEIKNYLKDKKNLETPQNIVVSALADNFVLRRKTNKKPSYPVPAWEMFNLENYWSLPYSHGPRINRYFPMLTSRGCSYSCDFCIVPSVNDKNWRAREPEEVVEEMFTLKEKFGVSHFQIEDLNPTLDSSRWTKICSAIIERGGGIFFYFVSGTKAETIKIDQVPLFAKAGCRYISISPESGSAKVLKAMGKSFDYSHGLAFISECHKHGIYTQACFLVGHPSETYEDHRLSCDYLSSLIKAGLDEAAVFVISPLAGSGLFRDGIPMSSSKSLISFSPKGRQDWLLVSKRRREIVKVFLIEKLKRGMGIWLQAIRAVLGKPRTKIENLPRRIMFIYRQILRLKMKKLFL